MTSRAPQIMALARRLSPAIVILAALHPVIVFAAVSAMSDAQIYGAVLGQAPQDPVLPSSTRALVIGLTLVPAIILSLGLLQMRHALNDMRSGDAFSSATSRSLRWLGTAIVASTLAKAAIGPMLSMLLTWHHEETQFALSFGLGDIKMLVLGTALWLFASVMAEGHDLAAENKQFV